MKRFIVFILMLCLTISLCGCVELTDGTTSTTEPVSQATAPATPVTTEATEPPALTVGDTAETADILVTLVSTEESEGDSLFVPEEGNVFVFFEILLNNTGSDEIAISSLLCFDAYADDFAIDFTLAGLADGSAQLDGSLQPGKKMQGKIGFEAPKDWSVLELYFDPILGGRPVSFIINK